MYIILALARKHNFPLPPTRAPELRRLLNVCAARIEIGSDESAQGFNRRLLNGLQRGAAECGAELANYEAYGIEAAAWPLVVSRREVDGVVMSLGNEFVPHPPYPAPVPAVFIFAAPEAARMLYWRLAQPNAPPRRVLLTAPLVEGGTTRAVSGLFSDPVPLVTR